MLSSPNYCFFQVWSLPSLSNSSLFPSIILFGHLEISGAPIRNFADASFAIKIVILEYLSKKEAGSQRLPHPCQEVGTEFTK